jgi:hypothetical protein
MQSMYAFCTSRPELAPKLSIRSHKPTYLFKESWYFVVTISLLDVAKMCE